MKCPKCAYLGFETGDRCKNCGYDFSLLAAADSDSSDRLHHASSDELDFVHQASSGEPDYVFRTPSADDVSIQVNEDLDPYDRWFDNRREPLGGKRGPELSVRHTDAAPPVSLTPESPFADEPPAPPPVVHFVPVSSAEALPLFRPSDDADDEPLIKMPAAPRAPLAVRRTPDTPRLRAVARPAWRPPAPVLQFSEEPLDVAAGPAETLPHVEPWAAGAMTSESSRTGGRLMAAVVDHAILLGIDLGVVYFTVRMAGLSMSEWNVLPIAPMLTFLGLLKISYFYAFTAVGGQTIGKMAVGTCVIAEDGAPVDSARAMRRTCAGVLSVLLLGLGFAPALFGNRRALHDRLAGTRVVRLRSV
jgi:uncharacterized RDD family membrane protein YckC